MRFVVSTLLSTFFLNAEFNIILLLDVYFTEMVDY